MEKKNEMMAEVQDCQSLKGALLLIKEALETGVWQKSFFLFNDEWIEETLSDIARMLRDKHGIDVPDSEV